MRNVAERILHVLFELIKAIIAFILFGTIAILAYNVYYLFQ